MPTPPLDPATRLICDLLRLDERPCADLPARLAQIDPAAFVQQANTQRLAGPLYRRLRAEAKRSPLPAELLDPLRLIYLSQAAESMRRSLRLGLILGKLHDLAVPAIVLKGAYLGELIYPDPAERPMGDIDLLVRHQHLEAAAQALVELGYHPQAEYWQDVVEQTNHHLPPYHKSGAEPVEVHWTIESHRLPFIIDSDGLWQRADPCQIAGQPAYSLSPADLLLHLSVHAVQHRFGAGLRAVYDVAVVCAHFQDELDWQALRMRAGEWAPDGAAARALYLMLWLAGELFAAPLPEEALRSLQPPDYSDETGLQALHLVAPPLEAVSTFPTSVAELVQKPGLAGLLEVTRRYFFLPREVLATCYPPVRPDSWQIYLYYPVRWKDLLIKRWQMVWKLARRDPATLSAATTRSARNEQEDALMEWVYGQAVKR